MISRHETRTRDICRELIGRISGKNDCDTAVEYAQEIPVRVIAHMLGVPEQDADQFRKWIKEILEIGVTDYSHRQRDQRSSSPRHDQLGTECEHPLRGPDHDRPRPRAPRSLPQSDIGKLQQPAPHAPLQHRAAYRQPDEFARRVAQIAALIEPKNSVEDIARDSALRYHFTSETRKQLFEHLASPGEQAVGMSSLRNAFARFVRSRDRIALDYIDFVIMIGQGARGQKAAHARTDYDCPSAETCHGERLVADMVSTDMSRMSPSPAENLRRF